MDNDNSTIKLIVISILIGVLALIGAIYFFGNKPKEVKLPILVEEFTDFQCPYCALYHPVIKEIVSEFGEDVEYKFVHNPLLSLHPDVKIAHIASYAALKQNKFNEYADILFENQSAQSESDLINYALTLGLDIEQFKIDLYSEESKLAVESDMNRSIELSVNATPTFFINGQRVVFKNDDNPEDVLRNTIKSLIEQAKSNN